jgi:hypothetical protein
MKQKMTMMSFVFTISGLLAGEKLALRHGADPYTVSFVGAALVGLLAATIEAITHVSTVEVSRRLWLMGWFSAAALLGAAFVPEITVAGRPIAYLGAAVAGVLVGIVDGRRLFRALQPQH